MRRRLTALLIAAALAPAALAQPAQAPVAPSALARQFEVPFETFTLANGLRVVVHEDRKAPVVAVHAWYNVGSKDEPEGRTGFAHLFEHIGLFNGTENLPNGLMEPLRQLGATDWNGTTFFDRTNYFQTVPTAALERALYMESDRMGHLLGALTQERLDNQRGVVQNEKRQGDNQPYGLIFQRMLNALFPAGHPYRHSTIGSMADLDAASLEDVRRWFRENYGPNNAVLVLAGDINAAEARPLVERYFGHIPRGPANEPAEAPVTTLPARIDDRTTDRVSNTRLYRAWVVPGLLDGQSVPLDAAADILGGLASARLQNELVRGDQSAIAASASLQPFQRLGIFFVQVDVKPGGDADAVGRRLDAIIADLAANGPSADEVRRTVTADIARQVRNLEQVGGFTGKAVVLAEGMLYADDPGFYRRRLETYAALTPADIRAAAGRWLTRPAYALRVDPGEREAYQEAAANRPAPAPDSSTIQIVPRAPMPAVGSATQLDLPTIERATLSNGIGVTYMRRAAIPTVQIAVEFDAGNAADPADRLGLQTLMLNLMQQGTTSRDALRLAEEQERLGATLNAFATLDRSSFRMATMSANLGPSLDLLADVIRNPAFAPAEIERLRTQQLAFIAAEQAQPFGMASRALPALLYGEAHPYGRPFSGLGNGAALRAVTREEIAAFHQGWIRPDTAQIFAVGDLPLAQFVAQLESRLGNWRNPAAPRGTKNFDAAVPQARSRIVLIDRPQSPQSMILAGIPLPQRGTDDQINVLAANEVLSGNFLSRINQDLRETRGWSYGINGQVQPVRDRQTLIIQAPVQTNQTGPSIAGIIDHVRRFTSDRGVTAPELERVIAGNTRQLPGQFETSTQLLNALTGNALFGRPDSYQETLATRYTALTAAMLDESARRAFSPDGIVFVVIGDASVVRPQLDQLGLPVEQISPR